MSFSLSSLDGVVTWDDGTVDGYPYAALDTANDALGAAVDSVGATPTGPFFQPGSPEHAFLVLRQLWPLAEVDGEPPVFESQGDELDDPSPLSESVFDEVEHPRGRAGKWVAKSHSEAAAAAVSGLREHLASKGEEEPESEMERATKNFTKAFKGRVVSDPEVVGAVTRAMEHNAGSEVHARLMAQHGEDRAVVIRGVEPTVIDPGRSMAHRMTGNRLTVIREEALQHHGEPGEIKPGDTMTPSGGGLAAVLRHEYGHTIESSLTPEEKIRFFRSLPSQDEVKKGLSTYAGFHVHTGNAQEAFSELYSVVSDPHYDPAKWPEWVRLAGSEWFGVPAESVKFEGDWSANPERKREVESTVSGLLSRYDVPLKRVQVRESEEFDQLAGKSKDTIYLSPRFLDDKFMTEHMKKWGEVSVTKEARDIVTHEFGHIVDGEIQQKHPAIYARLNKWFEEKVTSSIGELPRLRQGLEAPSAYGSENRYEFFAEGFTDWVLNGEKAHPSSRFIGKLADEALGRKLQEAFEGELHPRDRLGKWARKPGRFAGTALEASGARGDYRIEKTGKVWEVKRDGTRIGLTRSTASAKEFAAEHDHGAWTRDRSALLKAMFASPPTAHAHELWGGDPVRLPEPEFADARARLKVLYETLPNRRTVYDDTIRGGLSAIISRGTQDRLAHAVNNPVEPVAKERWLNKQGEHMPVGSEPPKFKNVGERTYDSEDGRLTMYAVPSVRPPAWNVEPHTDYAYAMAGSENADYHDIGTNLVDGVESRDEALRSLAADWPEHADRLRRMETARYGEEEPVDVKGDVALAAKLLGEGKRVRLNQPHEVSTLLDKLAEIVAEANAKGEQAPMFDLCKVSVRGTNLFCEHSKGIPRLEMPQLKGEPTPGSKADALQKNEKGRVSLDDVFIQHLRAKGVGVEQTTQKASFLRASQHELNGANVARISREITDGRPTLPIFVSRDDYIVDGHHQWAATVGHDSRDGSFDIEMPVQRIDMPITDVLEEARQFAADWGLAPHSLH